MGCCVSKSFKNKDKSNEKLLLKNKVLKKNNWESINFVNLNVKDINKEYKIFDNELGTGSYSIVKKAIHKETREERAIKIIPMNDAKSNIDYIKNEINILSQLDHPLILKVIEFFNDDNNFYIIMELCLGIELFEEIISRKNYSELECKYIFKNILLGVNYLHENNIIHRDLKPENILIDEFNIKIIDLGTAITVDDRNKYLIEEVGSKGYSDPNIYLGKYNEKCDVWSCGVILYTLLIGNPPFLDEDKDQIFELSKKPLNFNNLKIKLSKNCKLLLKKMIEPNLEKRCLIKDLLNDPWFSEINRHKSVNQYFLNNFLNFKLKNRISGLVFQYLLKYFPPKDELELINEIFTNLDLNGDGLLQKDEILNAFKNKKYNYEENKIIEIINNIDNNENEEIDYTEFCTALVDKSEFFNEENCRKYFNFLDKNKEGFIPISGLKENLLGIKDSSDEKFREDVNKMFSELDSDKNGQIEFDEFVNIFN